MLKKREFILKRVNIFEFLAREQWRGVLFLQVFTHFVDVWVEFVVSDLVFVSFWLNMLNKSTFYRQIVLIVSFADAAVAVFGFGLGLPLRLIDFLPLLIFPLCFQVCTCHAPSCRIRHSAPVFPEWDPPLPGRPAAENLLWSVFYPCWTWGWSRGQSN